MSKSWKKRDAKAKQGRLDLIEQLGAYCRLCHSTKDLTIEHINKRAWQIRKYNQAQRLEIYKREAEEKLITVLCYSCNSKKIPTETLIEQLDPNI